MSEWNRIERGTGRPLLLLHGGGSSARAWLPVLDLLAAHRRVIALDFPGFGRTPPLAGDEPFSMDLAMRELAAELARLGIGTPVDMAGNSMGGWMAFEAAKRGMAASVVAIGPAGLWSPGMPRPTRLQFRLALASAWLVRTPARTLLRFPAARAAVLSVPVKYPRRLTTAEAIGIVDDLYRSTPTLRRALHVAFHTRFEGGQHISTPMTVAFGSHDHMVRPGDSRFLDQLPAQTRVVTLPGCGHMPMWDDPELVARTILDGIATPTVGEVGA
ncbi:alpha/beta fold hydrolase [Nocardia huaxiensis]|uniref:Alpha/beta hydrolase n=1 Tax=Nocardia huaxiensis TaxID=2755382 RepID=A0A7D6Z140_9NOCA|nr:alpha/beta hydrolase [Nocardia huaxiensis]QLY29886.1 alpha/beta hydrolase [Nocardia huaxiensis]UFS96525.1 alpha/beta hydrolase [Nocardia huaxiensis]